MYYTVEAKTRSIARPLGDSSATCRVRPLKG